MMGSVSMLIRYMTPNQTGLNAKTSTMDMKIGSVINTRFEDPNKMVKHLKELVSKNITENDL